MDKLNYYDLQLLEQRPRLYNVVKYNKDPTKTTGYDTIICVCGACMLKMNWSQHKKASKKHKKYIEFNNAFVILDPKNNQISLSP